MAKANIATLNEVGAKKIVASCPHCFNTMKNEYPGLGGEYEMIHHAQLLSHLERQCLRAFGIVRAYVDVDERP